MRFLGSKYANNAFADPTGGAYSAPPDLAGKGEWGPGMAPTRKGGAPGRRGGGREGEGRGKGGKLLPPGVRFYG